MNPSSMIGAITPVTVSLAFITLVIYIIITFVLDYHLRRYITPEMRPSVSFARIIYIGVSMIAIAIICLLGLSLFSPQ